jgi:hypothetical protein
MRTSRIRDWLQSTDSYERPLIPPSHDPESSNLRLPAESEVIALRTILISKGIEPPEAASYVMRHLISLHHQFGAISAHYGTPCECEKFAQAVTALCAHFIQSKETIN